jgi:hypothetical protein
MTGRRPGDFEVVRELGRGGTGVGYEAVQTTSTDDTGGIEGRKSWDRTGHSNGWQWVH